MEVEVDLTSIRDEELLRRMWQQSEDFGRKKEIRQHLYKLREARLRDFYTIGTEIMDFTDISSKSPLTPSHGDSLADQSFQSFKSKEIRDSESPTKDMKFAQQQLRSVGGNSSVVVPDTSGWNIVTSSEVKPDGSEFKTETLATTQGVRQIDGGKSEFAGKNEHLQQASHKGDDKNFVKTAAESSNTHLQESSVVGDEKSGRIEKKSSTVVSSSSKSFISQQTTGDETGFDHFPDSDLMLMNRRDSTQSNLSTNSNINTTHQMRQLTLQEKLQQTRKNVENKSTTSIEEVEQHQTYQQKQQQHQEKQQYTIHEEQQHQQQQQQQQQTRQQSSSISKENERFMTKFVGADGLTYTKSPIIDENSPVELQHQLEKLQATPGKIISRTIEYPKPNLRMIVEKKELADGTIVTTRNYETKGATTESQQKVVSGSKTTEERQTTKGSVTDNRQFSKTVDQRSQQILRDTDRRSSNTTDEINNRQTKTITNRNTNENIHSQNINEQQQYEQEFTNFANKDTVDRGYIPKYRQAPNDRYENLKDQVETFETHKTVKKDLSETMRKENITSQDFIQNEKGCIMIDRNNSVPGRPEKYISEPRRVDNEDCYKQTTTSQRSDMQNYNTTTRQNDDETYGYPSTGARQIPRNNQKTNETYVTNETIQRTENRTEKVKQSEDFTTHGFPSAREPIPKQIFDHGPVKKTSNYKQPEEDLSTHGFPSARAPNDKTPVDHGYPGSRSPHDKQNVNETYETSKTTYRSENVQSSEDFTTQGFPSARDVAPKKPFDHGQVKSPKSSKHPDEGFSTHGFPSARAPNEKIPVDHGYPGVRSPTDKYPNETVVTSKTTQRTENVQDSKNYTTHGYPSARIPDDKKPETKKPDDYSTHGYPSSREPKNTTNQTNKVEIQKVNQYQTNKKVTENRIDTEVQTSTDSLRREKKTDAAHDAFARSLRCASPIDSPRRDSNASQKSLTNRTHSIQTSRGSTPTYRTPTATSKLKTRDVYRSNETIDYGTTHHSHHSEDDIKRRGGPSKLITTTTTTTTKTSSTPKDRDNSGSPDFKAPRKAPHEPNDDTKTTRLRPDSKYSQSPERTIVNRDDTTIKTNTNRSVDRVVIKEDIIINESTDERKPSHSSEPHYASPKSKPTSKYPKSASPDRTNVTRNDTTKKTINTHNEIEYLRSREPHYESPKSKPIAKYPKSTSPDRTTVTISVKEDLTVYDSPEDNEPSQPHYASPKSKPNSKYPKSVSPDRTNVSKTNTTIKTVKSQKIDKTITKEDSTAYDSPDETGPSKSPEPHYASPKSKPNSKYPKSVSPERSTVKTMKTKKIDNTIIKESSTVHDSPDETGPSHLPEPHYASPKSKPTSKFPKSVSPDRTNVSRNDTTTKTVKSQKIDKTIIKEDSTIYDSPDETGPSKSPKQHYDSPKSKPIAKYPKSTSPDRTNVTRDDSKFETTYNVNKVIIKEDLTVYDSPEDNEPLQPHYASPKSKPNSKYPKSVSPDRTNVSRNDTTTKTVKTQKIDKTIIQEDSTIYDSPDETGPSKSPEQHYDSPKSKPIGKYPKSSSPERTTDSKNNTTTKTIKSQKIDNTIIKEDLTVYDSPEDTEPSSPHFASDSPNNASTKFTKTQKIQNAILRDTTKKLTKEEMPSDDEPSDDEEESLRSGSPNNDFKYCRNVEVKSTKTTTDLDSEYSDVPKYDLNSKRSDIVNTQFITMEKENVHVFNKKINKENIFRPRSTNEDYPDEIINVQQPKSKLSRDENPNEPFFLNKNPKNETDEPSNPKNIDKPVTKKPFERRETFDDRARQVLGINETSENTTISTNKNKYTLDFINHEKNTQDVRITRDSSSPSPNQSPVPSPRSTSPKKTSNKPNEYGNKTKITKNNEILKEFTDYEKEFSEDLVKIRSNSPSPVRRSKQPSREISPSHQKKQPNVTDKNPSYESTTKTTIQKDIYSSTSKDTAEKSNYSRQQKPRTSPERTKSPKSPKHQTFEPLDDTQNTQNHITMASIQISPSKHAKPEINVSVSKPQITTSKTTTSKTTNINKKPNGKDQSKSQPMICSDSEIDKESDVVSDDEDLTTITTKTTTTTIKKGPLGKKQPIMERKESAPVYRTTHIDREQKMIRSTSDNILKTNATKRTKTTEAEKLKSPRKSSFENKKDLKTERRPSKCLTTKTINLSTKNIINSHDMENVIIDIQQAKSSREPSPNKMIPIPVLYDEETGKPRYPDTVQEPEENPRKPKIKNIPIFEESRNDFIGCQITEVEEDKLRKEPLTRKLFDGEDTTVDEDSYVSVHDKVTKFITTAEEIKKPKASSPFQRDIVDEDYPEDVCLLSVNDKVNKFLITAEKVTNNVMKRVNLNDMDEKLHEDRRVLDVSKKYNKLINTTEKLSESVPQKSPELVAKIEKQISRQSDDDRYEPKTSTSKITTSTIKSKITERYKPDKQKKEPSKITSKPVLKTTDVVSKAKSVFENIDIKDVKLSKTTNSTKQKDIISRPSIWENQKSSDVKLKRTDIQKNQETPETVEPRYRAKPTNDTENVKEMKTTNKPYVRDSVLSKKKIFDNVTVTSKTELSSKASDVTARLTNKTTSRRPSETSPTRSLIQETTINSTIKTNTPSKTFKTSSPKVTPKDTNRKTPKYNEDYEIENTDDCDTHISQKRTTKQHSSTLITSKTGQRSPEQSPIRYNPDEYARTSPATKRPETYYSKNSHHTDNFNPNKPSKVVKSQSPRRSSEQQPYEEFSPTRLTSRHLETNTTSTTSTTRRGDQSPEHFTTRPSRRISEDSQKKIFNKHPENNSPRRDLNDASPSRSTSSFVEKTTTYKNTSSKPESPSVQERKHIFENPDSIRPSYMDHTKASLEHIRRDSLEISRTSYNRKFSADEESFDGNPSSSVKFGVDLKHYEQSKPKRKTSSPDIPHVEEIFDLDLLEQMLSVVVGYEQRRRIRTQIRIVKKMIEQNMKEKEQIAYIRETSPVRRSVSSERESSVCSVTRENLRNQSEDDQIAYIRETSPARRVSPTRSVTSTTKTHKQSTRTTSSSSFIERESKNTDHHDKARNHNMSPQNKNKKPGSETRISGEKLSNKTKSVSLQNTKPDNKPIWATKNILKKASENNRTPNSANVKKTTSSTVKTSQSQFQRQKVSSDEDCITSSYGIGPTDDDGRPLFGIRALKKRSQPNETSKVTGTMITENFYSENGAAPIGERKITVYSSNPNDIDEYESQFDNADRSGLINRKSSKQNGVTSVTRTQKFGDQYGEPQYSALTDESTNRESTKTVRKGSVKEMSEKFIRKESSSSVTEQTTSNSSSNYPKAGLILRTKTTSRESTPIGSSHHQVVYDNEDDDYEYNTSNQHCQIIDESESESESVKVTKSVNISSKSFLNSAGTKVTGVHDVLDKMRNADYVVEDGDTLEDQEARSLLNKFLGASVLMSGVESMVPKEIHTTRTVRVDDSGPFSQGEVKTTRITKTYKTEGSSSSPVTQETFDIEEILDIEYLKQLLEQSTNYEERRKLRARIKQLMAEREALACAEIVASTKAELQSSKDKKCQQLSKVEKIVIKTVEESEDEDDDEEESVGEEEEAVNDSSSSDEYEEVIVEVTDSDDDDYAIDENTNSVKPTSIESNDKKSIVQTQTVVETKTVIEKGTEKVGTNNKEGNKVIMKIDKGFGKDNNSTKEGNPKNIEEEIVEGGDSLLLPLLQGLLHKNTMPINRNQATTTNQNALTNINKNSNKNNINPFGSSGSSNKNISKQNQVYNINKTSQSSNTQQQPQQLQKNVINTSKSSSSLTNKNNISGHHHHHIEDSGTESGEDLRLIAAGLRDSMQMHSMKDPNDTELISEVTTALNRLEQSLKEGKHLQLETSKRNALLALVGRLQTGLISPDKITAPTPIPDQLDGDNIETSSPEADNNRGSNRQRFAKRRSRANRHTVGVSREELADARRYMEEMVMIENMSNCTTPESGAVTSSDFVHQKQTPSEDLMEESINVKQNLQQPPTKQSTLYRPNQFVPNNLKDITAGGSQENPHPVVQMREKKPKYEQRLSANLDQPPASSSKGSRRPLSDSYTAAFGQQYQPQILHEPEYKEQANQTIYESSILNVNPQLVNNQNQYGTVFSGMHSFDIPDEELFESTSPMNTPLNRFSNKKLAMKRANTIDIPKPMRYLHDMESDSDAEDRGVSSTKSIGLRGTVQVSVKNKPRQVVPAFQPKTENDLKFLQFIQKQGPTPNLGWNNPNRTVTNWTNKFGNIKNTFEQGAATTAAKPPVPASAAKHFWKKADTQLNSSSKPKGIGRPPWADQNYSSNVLTSALKTKERNEYPTAQFHDLEHSQQYQHIPAQQQYSTSPQQLQQQNIQMSKYINQQQKTQILTKQQSLPNQKQQMQISDTQKKIIKPKPITLNQFSHAPQSVFKPLDPMPLINNDRFKPIQNDTRLHQSEPYLNNQIDSRLYHDQKILQDQPKKSWGLVGKYSAPSSPHHSIPSPTKSWIVGKTSTPSSPVTTTLPWLSKNKVENRIRSKTQKFDKRSPPPSNLHRHNSLRNYDQVYEDRTLVHDLNKSDQKRPSLPNSNDPYINGSFPVQQSFYNSNPKLNYTMVQDSYYQPPAQYISIHPQYTSPQPEYYPPEPVYDSSPYVSPQNLQTYQRNPYSSTDFTPPTVSTFIPNRSREESLTNPNAEPLVLTNAKPMHYPVQPLKIFDYPSPTCSLSSPNFTQNDITDEEADPESLTEYKVQSKVMTAPVCQQAVSVVKKTKHTNNEDKYSSGAKNLLSVIKNIGNNTKSTEINSKSQNISLDGRPYQAPLVESIFPDNVTDENTRLPMYSDPKNNSSGQTNNANSNFSTSKGQEQVNFVAYQKNPTYVPPVLKTHSPAMYSGYPPNYQLPPETYVEPEVKPNSKHQIKPITGGNQKSELRQNQTSHESSTSVQNYEQIVKSQQNQPPVQQSYPDVQKNLNQYREVHENYPKSFDQYHQPIQEQQKEVPKKKYMPKIDFQDAPRSQVIVEQSSKVNNQPKITYQDLKTTKKQTTEANKSVFHKSAKSHLKPLEIDPQSPKFYQDIQPPYHFTAPKQVVQQADKSIVKMETQKSFEEPQQQKQTNKSEQKIKNLNEQFKKQTTSSNQVVQQQQKVVSIKKVNIQEKNFQENQTNIKNVSETQKSTKTIMSQAGQEIVKKTEYKSSQPADTPDIVKSSLPKDENFPILKKFGPPQRHFYTPNAYQNPLAKSDSHSNIQNVKPVGPIMTRKFSDPSITAKYNSAPEIIETPSTPLAIDSKDDIPRNIVFNNVAQFSNYSKRIFETNNESHKYSVQNNRPNTLSKSDSWHKICQQQQQQSAKPPSPNFNDDGGSYGLRRVKSGHTLALPKMYEAGIKREEISEKQKTVAAYFSGQKSPNSNSTDSTKDKAAVSLTKRTSINRIRTSEKTSVNKQYPNIGLARSATMPHILNLLDENNVEDAFEELINS